MYANAGNKEFYWRKQTDFMVGWKNYGSLKNLLW